MGRVVNLAKSAAKDLMKIPVNSRRTILTKIAAYADDPVGQSNNVKQLSGSSDHRLRVGDYRVVFYLTAETMEIVKIGPRGNVYE